MEPKIEQADDRNKGNGTFEAGWKTAKHSVRLVGASLTGSSGTTKNFVRIGHSLLTLIAAFLGALLSRYLFRKNRELDSGPVNPQV